MLLTFTTCLHRLNTQTIVAIFSNTHTHIVVILLNQSKPNTHILSFLMLSLNQRKFITMAPMVSGPLSLVASISLITMIFKSASKLKIPVRRIFFGLCVYDCIYSFGQSMSTIPMPKDPGIWGTFGNVHSCNFQGSVYFCLEMRILLQLPQYDFS